MQKGMSGKKVRKGGRRERLREQEVPEPPRGLHAVRPSAPSHCGAGPCQGSGSLWKAHSNSVPLFSWKQDWTWTWVICSQRLTG